MTSRGTPSASALPSERTRDERELALAAGYLHKSALGEVADANGADRLRGR